MTCYLLETLQIKDLLPRVCILSQVRWTRGKGRKLGVLPANLVSCSGVGRAGGSSSLEAVTHHLLGGPGRAVTCHVYTGCLQIGNERGTSGQCRTFCVLEQDGRRNKDSAGALRAGLGPLEFAGMSGAEGVASLPVQVGGTAHPCPGRFWVLRWS